MNNELLEEEIEIIDSFNKEMDMYGHNGYCSFNKEVENGYFVYKEDNYWTVEFYEKGKMISCNRYTNIYNACTSIMDEMKIDKFFFLKRDIRIPRGTRVVITKSSDCIIDEVKMGVIVTSQLQQKDHSQPERVYQVFGDDGRVYMGLFGLKIYGDIYFRTMEDFIKDVENQRKENVETAKELIDTNIELYLKLQDIKGEKDKYLNESIFSK